MSFALRRAQLVLVSGLAAIAAAVPGTAHATTVDVTVGAATNVAIRAAGPGGVAVSWSAASVVGVIDWEIVVTETSADGTTSHGFFQPPTARSFTVSDLPAGATVHALVATFAGGRLLNISATTPDVTVPGGLCAGVSAACIGADATRSLGPEQHVAQGFLHGLGLTSTGVAELQALHPTSWRITEGSPSEMSASKPFGASTTALLSDPWYEITYSPLTGAAMSPWQNWSAYQSFIVHEVQKRVADGNLPDYWEIQNEPDVPGYYNPAFPPTASLLEQQFEVAYDAIKSVLPDAKIVGPSLGGFNLVGDAGHLALLDFINYATTHNLHFAAISWHENNAGNGALPSLQLPVMADHIQMIRTALDASPVLAGAKIFVNEFDSPETGRLVGWDLGHVIALEQGGADQANRACFEDCTNGADSLLDPADEHTPRMTYWGRLAYAQMTGSRVDTITTQRDTTAMTTLDATAQSLTTIVARHHGCDTGGNTACPSGSFVPSTPTGPLTLALKLPGSAGGMTATVSVTTLGATVADAANQPAATVSTAKVGGNGQLSVPLKSLADGAAYVVKVAWSAPTTTTAVKKR